MDNFFLLIFTQLFVSLLSVFVPVFCLWVIKRWLLD